MHYFDLKDGVLHAEGVNLETLAAEAGTPTYVYSAATLRRHYGLMRTADASSPIAAPASDCRSSTKR